LKNIGEIFALTHLLEVLPKLRITKVDLNKLETSLYHTPQNVFRYLEQAGITSVTD